jgi:hypothetical protein
MTGESKSGGILDVAPTRRGKQRDGFEQVQAFLANYGYLEPTYTPDLLDDTTSAALRTYQQLNALDATEEFDEPTRQRMAEPRCGLPDFPVGFSVYALGRRGT